MFKDHHGDDLIPNLVCSKKKRYRKKTF